MNSTCFLTFSQYMFLHFVYIFWICEKSKTKLQVQMFFHFSHIITGRSWADHGATMGDHANHARFQKSGPLRGSRKYQNFSFFTNEQHVFQSIELFVQYFVKKGVF